MPDRYPEIEPYDQGMLDVGDGNLLYWETCGNPDGRPAVVLHGGPGSGCSPGMRRSSRREVEWITRDMGRVFPEARAASVTACRPPARSAGRAYRNC